jgi:hypothetical protein
MGPRLVLVGRASYREVPGRTKLKLIVPANRDIAQDGLGQGDPPTHCFAGA